MSNEPRLTVTEALHVVQEYLNERNKNYLPWTINNDTSQSIQFYNKFFAIDGCVWLAELDFQDFDRFLVISDKKKAIEFLIIGVDKNKIPSIHPKLNIDRVIQISQDYNEENHLEGVLPTNIRESIAFYERYDGFNGYAWQVKMKVPPSPFGGDDNVYLIISDEKSCVEYIYDPSGYPVTSHLDDDSDEYDD
ncbi:MULTISPECIES: hypothetical protein [Bacillus]|uniref:hypothetical protein n=1 Tax=Bacillus TaxID=1386 RepID=UPI00037A43E1|nr:MULTISPECIES: hypothetical protein [Bacillus]MEB3052675.1 hypothetical protein [Bacillus pseudomycoides]MED4651230.1 hypothetical protein [Bacillus pseudomycoides]